MIHFESHFIRIHWDDDIKGVWAEWLGYAEGSDFRGALDAGLALLTKQRSKRWLADTRGLGPVAQEDQTWTNEVWFPRAIAGGVRYMAFVVPRKVVAQMAVKRVMSRVDGKELTTSYFDTLQEARDWLRGMG